VSDYFYNSSENTIFFYESLKTYQLNEIGIHVFEKYVKNVQINEIIYSIANEYEVDLAEAAQDVHALVAEFKQIGINPNVSIQNKSNKEDDFSLVSGCFHLHTPIVHIIQNCNSPCKMCDCWKTKEKNWHPAKELKTFFKKAKQLGAIAIMVSGGEPLLHPELRQIITDLKEIGLRVMLNTNALLLHKNLWIADLNLERLVVSMDGYNPETYKSYRGLNGYQIVWDNLKLFQKKSPSTQIGIRTILNKDNYDKMELLFDAIEENGMHGVGLSPADVSSISFSRNDIDKEKEKFLISLLLPSEDQINDFLQAFTAESAYYKKIEAAAEKGLSSWKPYDFIRCMLFYLGILKGEEAMFANRPCFFPYTSLVLDYNGDLRNCFYSPAFGNLYNFESIDWSFQNSMKGLKESGKCKSCRGNVFCGAQIPQSAKIPYADI